TTNSSAAPAASGPVVYQAEVPGQGSPARVVYKTTTGHIEELSLDNTGVWVAADLNDNASAPATASATSVPFAYETDLADQGPAPRVVYRTTAGHIEELNDQPGRDWIATDLNDNSSAPATASAAGAPTGYETDLAGQGPVARVVYR